MGLIARAIEHLGIPTVMLAALRKPAQLVHAPRVFFTGRQNSEIIGPPNDAATQRATLRRALAVLMTATERGSFVEMKMP